MNTPERILCVTHTFDGPAAQIALLDGRLTYLGGTPGTQSTIATLIDDIERDGVHMYVERLNKRLIELDAVKISVQHPLYLGSVAHAFRSRGWWAQTMARERAELWHDLVRLPIEAETKKDIMHRLSFVEGVALAELRGILKEAVRGFRSSGPARR